MLCVLVSSASNSRCDGTPAPAELQVQELQLATAGQAITPKKPFPFPAPDRLDVIVPSHSLKVAEENELTLRPHAPGLTGVTIAQVKYDPDDMVARKRPHFLHGGWASLPVLPQPDGSVSIKVIPLALGQLELQMTARFADGGFTKSNIVLNVQPSGEIPEKLVVGEWGSPSSQARYVTVFLAAKKPGGGLTVNAFYKNVTEEVEIEPSFASFKVRTANNSSPVISIDKATGLIRPVREGEALVETTFGGWTNLTCVVVQDHFDSPSRHLFDCRSQLRPGEQIGMSVRK